MTFFMEIFGLGENNNYMILHIDMQGQSISNASQLSAITYVYTLSLRPTHIEFLDVAYSGATDLINESGLINFMAFNVSSGFNIYNPLVMNKNALSGISSMSGSGDIAG